MCRNVPVRKSDSTIKNAHFKNVLFKIRVSLTVWKTWKASRQYMPSLTPSGTVRGIYALIKKAISVF